MFITKLAKRLNEDPQRVKDRVKALEKAQYLERVTGTMISYRLDKRNKVSKHRNHTYYSLTRKGRRHFRNKDVDLDVNLRPPYLQA